MRIFKQLSLSISLLGLIPLMSHAQEGSKILRLSECRFEGNTTRLKTLKTLTPFNTDDSIDLNFQSKQEWIYPIVDWKLIKQDGRVSSNGQIRVSLVQGGLNFVTWNAPSREDDDAFLMLRVNEKDCYYAQLKKSEPTNLEAPAPIFLKAQLIPLATSCSLQDTPANFAHMLISILLFSLILFLMYRLRIHSQRLHF